MGPIWWVRSLFHRRWKTVRDDILQLPVEHFSWVRDEETKQGQAGLVKKTEEAAIRAGIPAWKVFQRLHGTGYFRIEKRHGASREGGWAESQTQSGMPRRIYRIILEQTITGGIESVTKTEYFQIRRIGSRRFTTEAQESVYHDTW